MQPYMIVLQDIVARAEPALLAISDAASAEHPVPGKWSPKEIVGHLIDSASNNHQRFVRAQWQDDLVFSGYGQAEWVSTQRYQEAPWRDLVTLWASFNRHMVRVMAAVPDSIRTRARARHNLHEIAWRTVPQDEPATLDDVMSDYVGHLQHHLRQIFGSDGDAGCA